MSRLEKIPVPCIATFLSFMTLGNVYGGLLYHQNSDVPQDMP